MEECSDGSCGEGKENRCCQEESKQAKPMAAMIMQFANDAWADLMKDKMKLAYEKVMGDKMDKAAQIGVEACIAYWNGKMMEEHSFQEFEEKLKKAMK